MARRFFNLLYFISLALLVLSLPFYVFSSGDLDKIYIKSYKAKCLSSGQYVILQGAREPYIFDDYSIRLAKAGDLIENKKDLNFYCKYFNEVKPYVDGYDGSYEGNVNFFKLKDSVISGISAYPELYKLEVVRQEKHYDIIYGLIVTWLIFASVGFVLMQVVKVCYLYVVTGRVVWHPFKS